MTRNGVNHVHRFTVINDFVGVVCQLSQMAITSRLATVFWWLSGMASSFISRLISSCEVAL
jgi:hypothetical protein